MKGAEKLSRSSSALAGFTISRWLLAPVTTWRALRLTRKQPGMDPRTAWMVARLAIHPEEKPLARAHWLKIRPDRTAAGPENERDS